MILRFLPLLLLACGASRSPAPGPSLLPYDLDHPSARFTLPDDLVEISALTDVDSSTVACVQDERGAIYFISLRDGRKIREVPFSGPGDMEGLTRVGGDYFALRSDGLVFRLRERHTAPDRMDVLDTFRIDVPNENIEGLGYDERNNRVLVSPKDLMKGSKEGRDERVLYAFVPDDPAHRVEEVLRLRLSDLVAQATALGVSVPERTTDKGRVVPALKLRYSSVSVHPMTGQYYLLSAVDRTLLVVDRAGKLIALEQLDEELLPKPEGITFLTNGDLVLSSEGKGGAPVIVRYAYLLN